MQLRYTTEEMRQRLTEKYGDKFNYDKFIYNGSHTKTVVTCPIHGDFLITPNKLLFGRGCPKCCKRNKSYSNEEFKEMLIKMYGNFYILDKVHYTNANSYVTMICPKHGEFNIKASHLLNGHECKYCSTEKDTERKKLSQDECLKRFEQVHGKEYIYTNVKYKSMQNKVCIICPKHGEFWQTPEKHIFGQGCPKCKRSHLENDIAVFLTNNNIEYFEQKKFSWLGLQSLDFYLPKYKIGIECQGLQHFEPTKHFKNSEFSFQRDHLKYKLCEENGVRLLYYTDYNINDEVLAKHAIYDKENLFFTKEELLNNIVNNE